MRFTSLLGITVTILAGLAFASSFANAWVPFRSSNRNAPARPPLFPEPAELVALNNISQGLFQHSPFAIVQLEGTKIMKTREEIENGYRKYKLNMVHSNGTCLRSMEIKRDIFTNMIREIIIKDPFQSEEGFAKVAEFEFTDFGTWYEIIAGTWYESIVAMPKERVTFTLDKLDSRNRLRIYIHRLRLTFYQDGVEVWNGEDIKFVPDPRITDA
ncbi:hypothetical protein THASP1DRAFT_28519 [Thamnocephalis sphaerospora]|uniref:Uncharacterized protein n=1 Tax=Thamnocephalis sphaerospora TaxID=78915 RepID=A0A4P9XW92_9FUNG|nr:hypothetical protein THASP1DRAFT_28519 [Thamnocephalis sphaerospora]|eukprot:RKP09690.1 hypothetical protein THASP1DRAFT_28519 [Thamnocephalis sphaerospora]